MIGMDRKCLFTDAALDELTKPEHTIPECIGGRIQSRSTTCSDFNNRCSSYPQSELAESYRPLLQALSPLLPSQFRPADLSLRDPERPKARIVMRDARIVQKNTTFEEDLTTGEFSFTGSNRTKIEEFAQRRGLKIKRIQDESLPDNLELDHNYFLSTDLAFLLAGITTFDHLLSTRDDNFSRFPELKPLMHAIRESIMKQRLQVAVVRAFMGIQYPLESEVGEIRKQLHRVESPFEHFALVSGTKSGFIDMIFVAFGFEAFGFQLATQYRGPDFAFGVVNPILQNEHPSGLLEFQPRIRLCTPLLSVAWSKDRPSNSWMNRLIEKRVTAIGQAELLVEKRCDNFVLGDLNSRRRSGVSDKLACIERVKSLYGSFVCGSVETELGELAEEVFHSFAADTLLVNYRRLLESFSGRHDVPARYHSIEKEIVHRSDRIGERS